MGKSNMKKMIVGGLAAVAAAAIGIALFPRRLPPRTPTRFRRIARWCRGASWD
jgi:hypothetical protein